MKKKILAIVLSIVMIMTSTAFAESIYAGKSTDNQEIEKITNSFFVEKENAFLSDSNSNFAEYYSTNDVKNIKNDSSFKLFEYEKQMRDDNKLYISDEEIEYTINSIEIIGDRATVNCYEYYEYTYKNDSERSSRGTEYQIIFAQKGGEWEIVNVTTDNELEKLFVGNDNASVKSGFDFEIEETEEESNDVAKLAATNTTTHEYDRSAAATYALKYSASSTGTSSYNSKFPNFTADCQNFVSQCVWSGLGGSDKSDAISNKNKPMITTTGREWYCASASKYSSSWTIVGDFRDYIAKEADEKEGIYGVRYAKGSIEKAQKGDVVQICDSNGSWYHSYIISSVTGTYGSRTLSNINICAHTTNRRNENLANVIGANSTNFRLLRINGTRY